MDMDNTWVYVLVGLAFAVLLLVLVPEDPRVASSLAVW
jgi:hypothetical protein